MPETVSPKENMARYLTVFKRYRTPVLAVLATAMLVASAIWSFDIPWQDMAGYLLVCVVGVGLIALSAAVAVAVIKLLR